MDAERLRQLVQGLLDKGGERAGAFERGPQPPPYHLAAGTHALDAEPASSGAMVVVQKGGAFGGIVGDMQQAHEVQTPNALPSSDDVHTLFTMAGALFPAYDPEVLSTLIEHSNWLRPNVDAYKTNIDGFGYQLDAIFDADDPKVDEAVADAVYLDALEEAESRGQLSVPYPEPDLVASKKREILALARVEKARIEAFFEHCAGDIAFKELRRRTREDMETTGNAYWEVLRNGEGQVAGFYLVPSYSMRLAPIEHVHHEVVTPRKVSPLRYKDTRIKKRFRRYIQIVLDRIVFFKEFGDSRVVSKRTGRVWEDEAQLAAAARHDGPATEIIHFRVWSPRSPYGIPRWIGALLAVLGSRASEEINYLYFDNKAVPPLALLVSGGKLAQGAQQRIESYVSDNLRGKENFHRIMIIEAESAKGGKGGGPAQVETGKVRLDLVPLRDAMQEDALFQVYDQNNGDKIGQTFRVPRLLRGDTRDFNRATAEAALEYAETQVFQGERETFDDMVNRLIFAALRVRFWRFKSNSPVNRDPLDLTKILDTLCARGILTAGEAREVAADILNKRISKIDADWTRQPMAMTLAGMIAEPDGSTTATATPVAPQKADTAHGTAPDGTPLPDPVQRDLTTLAGRLIALRDRIQGEGAAKYARALAKAHGEELKEITIEVPAEVIATWVTRDAAAE